METIENRAIHFITNLLKTLYITSKHSRRRSQATLIRPRFSLSNMSIRALPAGLFKTMTLARRLSFQTSSQLVATLRSGHPYLSFAISCSRFGVKCPRNNSKSCLYPFLDTTCSAVFLYSHLASIPCFTSFISCKIISARRWVPRCAAT